MQVRFLPEPPERNTLNLIRVFRFLFGSKPAAASTSTGKLGLFWWFEQCLFSCYRSIPRGVSSFAPLFFPYRWLKAIIHQALKHSRLFLLGATFSFLNFSAYFTYKSGVISSVIHLSSSRSNLFCRQKGKSSRNSWFTNSKP